MRIKWKCPICETEIISDSEETHTMDWCQCEKTAIDLEEHYCRMVGKPEIIKEW